MLATCHHSRITCILGSRLKTESKKQAKIFRNVRRMCWNKYVNELEPKVNERTLRPVPVTSSKVEIDVLANKVHSTKNKRAKAVVNNYNTYIMWITTNS